jgi:hypothetical protein
VVEAKRNYGYFYNPDSVGLRNLTLDRWTRQRNRYVEVADDCKLVHAWFFSKNGIQDFAIERWGEKPPAVWEFYPDGNPPTKYQDRD